MRLQILLMFVLTVICPRFFLRCEIQIGRYGCGQNNRQGQGIGKQMMEYAMAVCREHDRYKMRLSSNLKREQAHRFYESLGFTRHGYSYLIDL